MLYDRDEGSFKPFAPTQDYPCLIVISITIEDGWQVALRGETPSNKIKFQSGKNGVANARMQNEEPKIGEFRLLILSSLAGVLLGFAKSGFLILVLKLF